MALIECPECKKMISDTASSCPNCGYTLVSQKANTNEPNIEPIELGEMKKDVGTGIVMIVVGLIVALFSLLFIVAVVTIFSLIGGIALVVIGFTRITGYYEVECPYCGQKNNLMEGSESYKCTKCKKRLIRDGKFLKVVR